MQQETPVPDKKRGRVFMILVVLAIVGAALCAVIIGVTHASRVVEGKDKGVPHQLDSRLPMLDYDSTDGASNMLLQTPGSDKRVACPNKIPMVSATCTNIGDCPRLIDDSYDVTSSDAYIKWSPFVATVQIDVIFVSKTRVAAVCYVTDWWSQAPKKFKLYSSLDGVTYTEVGEFDGKTFPVGSAQAAEFQCHGTGFTIPFSVTARAMRFEILETQGSEIQMLEISYCPDIYVPCPNRIPMVNVECSNLGDCPELMDDIYINGVSSYIAWDPFVAPIHIDVEFTEITAIAAICYVTDWWSKAPGKFRLYSSQDGDQYTLVPGFEGTGRPYPVGSITNLEFQCHGTGFTTPFFAIAKYMRMEILETQSNTMMHLHEIAYCPGYCEIEMVGNSEQSYLDGEYVYKGQLNNRPYYRQETTYNAWLYYLSSRDAWAISSVFASVDVWGYSLGQATRPELISSVWNVFDPDPNVSTRCGDECEIGTDTCDTNADCVNTFPDYTCTCRSGFTGDGQTCADIDECATGQDNCDPNATCQNTIPGFTCTCPNGFTGDGTSCTDIDECAELEDNCNDNAFCTNLSPGFTCTCQCRFVGDGFTCIPDDYYIYRGKWIDCQLGDPANRAHAALYSHPYMSTSGRDECTSVATNNGYDGFYAINSGGSMACYYFIQPKFYTPNNCAVVNDGDLSSTTPVSYTFISDNGCYFSYPFTGVSIYNSDGTVTWYLQGNLEVAGGNLAPTSYVDMLWPSDKSFFQRVHLVGQWTRSGISLSVSPTAAFSFSYGGQDVGNLVTDTITVWSTSEGGDPVERSNAWDWTLHYAADRLIEDHKLAGGLSGGVITSPDGVYYAVMQTDCNFVIYKDNAIPTWHTSTDGKGSACRIIMQTDGNLIIYDGNFVPLWDTGAAIGFQGGYQAVMQNNGYIVIYDAVLAVVRQIGSPTSNDLTQTNTATGVLGASFGDGTTSAGVFGDGVTNTDVFGDGTTNTGVFGDGTTNTGRFSTSVDDSTSTNVLGGSFVDTKPTSGDFDDSFEDTNASGGSFSVPGVTGVGLGIVLVFAAVKVAKRRQIIASVSGHFAQNMKTFHRV